MPSDEAASLAHSSNADAQQHSRTKLQRAQSAAVLADWRRSATSHWEAVEWKTQDIVKFSLFK